MGKERMPIYMVPFAFKKGRIFVSVGHSGYGNFMNVIRMISAGLYDPTQAVTGVFKLDKIMDALEASKHRAGGKIMIEMF
jgi:scyllo-inosose 3-dehydrogenase